MDPSAERRRRALPSDLSLSGVAFAIIAGHFSGHSIS